MGGRRAGDRAERSTSRQDAGRLRRHAGDRARRRAAGLRRVRQQGLRVRRDRAARVGRVGVRRHAGRLLRGMRDGRTWVFSLPAQQKLPHGSPVLRGLDVARAGVCGFPALAPRPLAARAARHGGARRTDGRAASGAGARRTRVDAARRDDGHRRHVPCHVPAGRARGRTPTCWPSSPAAWPATWRRAASSWSRCSPGRCWAATRPGDGAAHAARSRRWASASPAAC